MALVEIPLVIAAVVAIGIVILTIAVTYFAIAKNYKQLELGEKEDEVIYGMNTKPIRGTYWQIYRSFDRAFHRDK
jgi:hypothetical protein